MTNEEQELHELTARLDRKGVFARVKAAYLKAKKELG